tara:strand:- start:401 stop:757 length:357 start_codon:yes stop_codon:yes gene_type:complete
MFNLLSIISQFNFLWIGIPCIFLFIFVILFLLLNSKNVKKASDGTVFSTEEEKIKYEKLLEKVNQIFKSIDLDSKSIESMGIDFEFDFIDKLRGKGFSDAQTLLKYRYQFKLLNELLD